MRIKTLKGYYYAEKFDEDVNALLAEGWTLYAIYNAGMDRMSFLTAVLFQED